jgi:hypothetical protein
LDVRVWVDGLSFGGPGLWESKFRVWGSGLRVENLLVELLVNKKICRHRILLEGLHFRN